MLLGSSAFVGRPKGVKYMGAWASGRGRMGSGRLGLKSLSACERCTIDERELANDPGPPGPCVAHERVPTLKTARIVMQSRRPSSSRARWFLQKRRPAILAYE